MSFQDSYKVLHVVSDGEVTCARAEQISSGQSVLVHQLWPDRNPPDQVDLAALLDWVARYAAPEFRERILECGEAENHVYAVTEDVPECLNLRAWLQSATDAYQAPAEPVQPNSEPAPAESGAVPAPAEINAEKAEDLPGEFTEWFNRAPAAEAPLGSSLNADEGALPLPASPAGTAAPLGEEPPPGSFTSMFLSPGKAGMQSPSPAPSEAPAVPLAEEPKPGGSFTSMFLTPGKAVAQPVSPSYPGARAAPAAEEPKPGSFTSMFLTPGKAGMQSPPPTASPEAPAAPPAGGPEPDSFTSIFRVADMGSQPAPSAPAPGESTADQPPGGEFTQVFFAKEMAPQPPQPPQPPSAAEVKQAPVAKTPPASVRGRPPAGFEIVYTSKSRKTRVTDIGPSTPLAAPPQAPGKPAPKSDEFSGMFPTAGTGTTGPKPASVPPPPLGDELLSRPLPDGAEKTEVFLTTARPAQSSPQPYSPKTAGDTALFQHLFMNGEKAGAPVPPPAGPLEASEIPSAPSGDAPREPGEFTRLFNLHADAPLGTSDSATPPGSLGSPLPPYPPAAVTPPQSAERDSAGAEGPGTFTQFFHGTGGLRGAGPQGTPPSSGPTYASSPMASSEKEPGAVTRILQGYRPPKQDLSEQPPAAVKPPSTPPVEPSGGGEYSSSFDRPTSQPPSGFPQPHVEPAPPPPKPPPGPGEYTRIIMGAPRAGAPAADVPQAVPPVAAAPPAAMPGFPLAAPPAPAVPPMPQARMPQPPAMQAPPLAYTPPPAPAYPVYTPPAPPAFPAYAPPPPAVPKVSPPASSQKPSFLVPIVVLGCLLMIAVILIVYFAVKH